MPESLKVLRIAFKGAATKQAVELLAPVITNTLVPDREAVKFPIGGYADGLLKNNNGLLRNHKSFGYSTGAPPEPGAYLDVPVPETFTAKEAVTRLKKLFELRKTGGIGGATPHNTVRVLDEVQKRQDTETGIVEVVTLTLSDSSQHGPWYE